VYQIFKEEGLLQRPRVRAAEVYQAARLFELLPSGPNDLWQADVTYVHVPGHGWWYAVTVIDYYSRYLLACHFTPSYRAADVVSALDAARQEAERHHGPLLKTPFLVTDNGSSFLAKRFQRHIDGAYAHVRINYRTPTQLGLLERFHQTMKTEEIYWHLYQSPAEARERLAEFRERYNTIRPHWALRPEEGGDPLTPHDVYVTASHHPARLADLGESRQSEARRHDRRRPRTPTHHHGPASMSEKGAPHKPPKPFQPNCEPRHAPARPHSCAIVAWYPLCSCHARFEPCDDRYRYRRPAHPARCARTQVRCGWSSAPSTSAVSPPCTCAPSVRG
jgi:transposase InsO family protein